MKIKTDVRKRLDSLHLPDIYSLMLFALYQIQKIPEYAVLSELCFLLDGNNLTRLLTHFAGKTITIPSVEEFTVLANALLLYQYINIEGDTLQAAQAKLEELTTKQIDETTELYLKLLPIMRQYNFNRQSA